MPSIEAVADYFRPASEGDESGSNGHQSKQIDDNSDNKASETKKSNQKDEKDQNSSGFNQIGANSSPGESKRGDMPLRELDNIEDIHSQVSAQPSTTSAVSPRQSNDTNLDESPKIISNPWSFFNRYDDKKESRYTDDQDEKQSTSPYRPATAGTDSASTSAPTDAVNSGSPVAVQTPSTPVSPTFNGYDEDDEDQSHQPFFPTKFSSSSIARREPSSPSTSAKLASGEDPKQQKLMKRLFRSRRRDRKKQSISADNNADQDDDLATGKRAQALIGRMCASADAISLLASCLLEDERGIGRAPLLLTLLGFRISDISPTINTKIRRFKIELEYGVGPQRMRWSVEKNAKDLLYLHSRFKFEKWRSEVSRSIKTELPKYPIPPLRGREHNKGKQKQSKSSNDAVNPQGLVGDYEHDNESITTNHTFRGALAHLRSQLSSVSSISSDDQSPEQLRQRIIKNQDYIKEVTKYLNDLISLVALRPSSNKLFQFFEISPISSLLGYESGYIGKQGVVHLGCSAKSSGWRVGHFKANDLKGMINRRSEKWFLIRNSYVMYVSDINSTIPLDVFIVDSKFKIIYKTNTLNPDNVIEEDDDSDYDDLSEQLKLGEESLAEESVRKNVFSHLKITLENTERKLVIVPKSVKEQKLWIKSLTEMKNQSVYSNPNRFGSFAPVRKDVFAQWFVDGRDYFWAVSSALEMAKDVIFIHDWWLSPELYLRRPANGNQQWRIDRILQRKAQQGVKIYVIVYRNVGTTVVTDSLYTKHSILSLNEENIHVIRSPNQLLQNTYFWAHHEKLCIIDHTVAFVGGIDLCFGRFDTPDHVLTDDSKINFDSLDDQLSPEEIARFQIFPGKDYSNPRVKDFFALDKPYESMYDRNKVPRMPWHDVHMVTSGKVARDLARHFVQRWNYLLRQKRPSRFTPLLTPPSDLSDEEARRMGLEGTCEVQLVRSSGNWSLGLKEHEQSIQNAYLKLIETSEHFVYIENQFFVTSCFIDGNEIKNRIGDALVDRIIKAYNEGTNWKAIIVIPLMPGFESQVDEPDGSSVRVIMQCQYMSISRGSSSIYAKLRKYGIEPDDYIQFFSLRKWGRIGPDRNLITEQLYIHAKTMIVDDRIALIGSANINERSMRGVRDSEVAAVVRDSEMIQTTMEGEPYLAGKFAHTLRMRLMREHLGVNVDILDIVERRFKKFEQIAHSKDGIKFATNKFTDKESVALSAMVEIATRDILGQKEGTSRWKRYQNSGGDINEVELDEEHKLDEKKIPRPINLPLSFNNRTGTHEANKGIRDKKKHSYDARVQHNDKHKMDVFGDGIDKYKSKIAKRARLNNSRFLKDLAKKAMKQNPTATFLPDLENVQDFLNADDTQVVDDLEDDGEKIITERNKERWALLKKISYLQRVAAKEKEEQDEEAKKRTNAGMEAKLTSHSLSSNGLHPAASTSNLNKSVLNSGAVGGIPATSVNDATHADVDPMNADFDRTKSDTTDDNSFSEKLKSEDPTDSSNENIPIVTLNENSTREVLQRINPQGAEHFSRYVDPYGFEDPLDCEFYEDLWYEHARRNTEIFRLIFHTQPDNVVLSWKEYKRHSKLQSAFMISQQQEAKRRRQKVERHGLSEETDTEDDSSIGDHLEPGHQPYDRSKRNSINVNSLEQDVGLLGHAPPTRSGSSLSGEDSVLQNGGKKRFRRHLHSQSVSKVERIDEEEDQEEENGDDTEGHEDEEFEEAQETLKDPNDTRVPYNGSGINSQRSHDGEPLGSSDVRPTRRRRNFANRRAHRGEQIFDRDSAERILNEIQGHLVLFPTEWLSRELEGGNWFYNTDRIPPIDIYD